MGLEVFFEIFGDKTTRSIFEDIVDNRRVSHQNLVDTFGVSSETVTASIDKLRKLSLVDETNSAIRSFITYYVTKDGLSAYRELEKLKRKY